jgi:hypothetical protein
VIGNAKGCFMIRQNHCFQRAQPLGLWDKRALVVETALQDYSISISHFFCCFLLPSPFALRNGVHYQQTKSGMLKA